MKMKKPAGMFLAAAVTAMIGVGGLAAPANAATLDDPNAQAMLSMVNQYRADNGLAPVVWNQGVADVSQYWSPIAAQDLVEDGSLDNPHNDNYFSMIPGGADYASENVAYGPSIEGVFNQWVNSPAHNANILDPNVNTFGFGYVTGFDPANPTMVFATQNFARYPNVDNGAIPTLTVSANSSTVHAGQNIIFSGKLANASDPVTAWVDTAYIMNDWSNQNFDQNYVLTPDAEGNFQLVITVPQDVRTGTVSAAFRFGELNTNASVNIVEAEVPVEPTPEVPTPEVPTPEVPTPEVPVEPTPEVPAPEVPVEPTPEVPTPEVPVEPTPEVPTPEVPVEPTPETPAPEVPVEPTPETPAPEVPETPAPETPEAPVTPAPEVPETPAPEVPETPTPETPEAPVTPAPEDSEKPDEAPVTKPDETPAVTPVENNAPVKNETPVRSDNGVRATVDNVLSGAVALDENNRGSFVIEASEDGKVLTITGLTPGVTYEIWLHSNPLFAGEYVADANGTVTVPVPEALENGDHKAVIYADGELVGWQDFSKGGAAELAYTGATGSQMATLGFAGMILLAGGVLMTFGRRGFAKN